MNDPRETRTNAADSAPGVDDGPAGVRAPQVNSKPGGRSKVWLGVILVCLVVLAAFLFPRLGSGGRDDAMVGAGATQGEIAASRVPGASNGPAPAPSPGQQGG